MHEDLERYIEREDKEDYVLVSTCKRCRKEIAFTAPNDIDKDLLTFMLYEILMGHYMRECGANN